MLAGQLITQLKTENDAAINEKRLGVLAVIDTAFTFVEKRLTEYATSRHDGEIASTNSEEILKNAKTSLGIEGESPADETLKTELLYVKDKDRSMAYAMTKLAIAKFRSDLLLMIPDDDSFPLLQNFYNKFLAGIKSLSDRSVFKSGLHHKLKATITHSLEELEKQKSTTFEALELRLRDMANTSLDSPKPDTFSALQAALQAQFNFAIRQYLRKKDYKITKPSISLPDVVGNIADKVVAMPGTVDERIALIINRLAEIIYREPGIADVIGLDPNFILQQTALTQGPLITDLSGVMSPTALRHSLFRPGSAGGLNLVSPMAAASGAGANVLSLTSISATAANGRTSRHSTGHEAADSAALAGAGAQGRASRHSIGREGIAGAVRSASRSSNDQAATSSTILAGAGAQVPASTSSIGLESATTALPLRGSLQERLDVIDASQAATNS